MCFTLLKDPGGAVRPSPPSARRILWHHPYSREAGLLQRSVFVMCSINICNKLTVNVYIFSEVKVFRHGQIMRVKN